MAEDQPQYRIIRREKYNPNFEDYQREEIPTNTIKRSGRITGVGVGTRIASHSTGPGSYALVTRLDVYADRETEFCIKDRTGTVMLIYLEAAGMHQMIGEQSAPVTILKGSAQIRNLGGTATGTYAASLEFIAPQFGTETVT
jgi:hypothetical protein